jgi:lipopolysaccharide/colanic/teichoic acid biosynthesis glycosyltransferase
MISLPAAPFVLLAVGALLAINKLLYPHHAALFLQDRVGQDERPLRVMKIRSMVPRETGERPVIPACTAFGRFIRRHYLDELPQMLQVLSGQLSLVGTRVLPVAVYEGLASGWSPQRFERWRAMYTSTPLGLTGPHQILRRAGKEDARRYHRDMFYARHASLGFDLYLLWRTLSARENPSPASRRTSGAAVGVRVKLSRTLQ